MEIVDYSKLPMDQQSRLLGRLLRVISQTPEFGEAQTGDQLIGLPSIEGMALVFFGDPVAPVRCASELARLLQSYPELKLRMGIHSGPVYRVAGFDSRANVAGEGIKTAQRIMRQGAAGHILVSKPVADTLGHLGNWAKCLHDIGEREVTPGTRLQLFNFYTGEAGNPEPPGGFSVESDSSSTPAFRVAASAPLSSAAEVAVAAPAALSATTAEVPVAAPGPLSSTTAAVPVAGPAARKVRPVLIVALVAAMAAATASFFVLNREPATPPLLTTEVYDEFLNLTRWTVPSSGWSVTNESLQIENQPELGFLNKVYCADFSMNFQVRLLNAAGVAWAVRVKDPKNYYLFYLAGPEGQFQKNRLLVYIVREGKPFSPSVFESSLPFQKVELRADGEYNIGLTAEKNKFTLTIRSEETGKEFGLGIYVDPENTYPAGGIGFRTVGVEKFSIDDLYVRPPGMQLPH